MRIQYSEGIILIGLMVDNVGLWPAKTFEWRRVTQDLRKGGPLEMLTSSSSFIHTYSITIQQQ